MTTVAQEDRLLTAAELAERWQVNPGSLAHWRVAGEGPPFVRIGKWVRYRLQDVTDYERNNLCQST